MITPSSLRETTDVLQAVGDVNRLRILKCLQVRRACVCELVQATGIPQPRISRHLKVLRDAGLVTDSRDAQWVEYSLSRSTNGAPAAAVLRLVRRVLEDDPRVLADREGLAAASRDQCVPGK